MIRRKRLLAGMLCMAFFTQVLWARQVAAQELPDSIRITDQLWNLSRSYAHQYTLVRDGNDYGDVPASEVARLLAAMRDTTHPTLLLSDFGLDSAWFARHQNQMFGYIRSKYDYWTAEQEAFAKKQLSDMAHIDSVEREVILQEGIVWIAKDYSMRFNACFYFSGRAPDSLSATENFLGLPWTVNGRPTFNLDIPRLMAGMLPGGRSSAARRFGSEDRLPRMLAEKVFDWYCERQIMPMAVTPYQGYIDSLRKDFQVLGAGESNYIWQIRNRWYQTFCFTLHSPRLPPGAQLLFYATRSGRRLYPEDSLLRQLPGIAERVGRLTFLTDYLAGDPRRKLNVFFFDNRGLSPDHITGFNGTPAGWKEHDLWVRDMHSLANKPDFDVAESIENSKEVNCGCNLRLDDTVMQRAVLLELRDENGGTSTWVLLPDDTPVLWHFEGEGVYRYTKEELGFKGKFGVLYPCRKADALGRLIAATE